MKKIFMVLAVLVFGFTMIGCDMGMSSVSPFEGVWQVDGNIGVVEYRGDTWKSYSIYSSTVTDYGTFVYDRNNNTTTRYWTNLGGASLTFRYEFRGNKMILTVLNPGRDNRQTSYTKIGN